MVPAQAAQYMPDRRSVDSPRRMPSLPTIQRMEASDGTVRGVVGTLMKVIDALDAAGIELIGNDQPCHGRGRGVRLKEPPAS